MTYRKSLLVAAAIGLGLSVSATPVLAANTQSHPAYVTAISFTKMVIPMKRLMPGSHKADSSGASVNASASGNTNAATNAKATDNTRLAGDTPDKN